MALLTDERPELPRLTRLVRSAILCGFEGLSVGVALAMSLYSSRLVQFVKTNRIEANVRKEMLAFVLWPAFLLPILVLTVSMTSAQLIEGRLKQMERRIRLLAPLSVVGFIPLLLHPALWAEQTLAFLMVAGVFATAVMLSIRVSASAWSERHNRTRWTDLDSLRLNLSTRCPPQVLSILAVLAIFALSCLSIVRPLYNTTLTDTIIHTEWAMIRKISESSGILGWFGAKGWRISGHFGCLGALYAIAAAGTKPGGLLLLRLLGVVLAAIPLFFWSKRSLGTLPAFVVSLAYLSMPQSGMLQLHDTFPITIALGVFFLAANWLQKGKLGRGLILVLLGIAFSEQVALWFALLGAYLTRWETRKSLGQWLAVTSLVYFLVVALYVLPHLGIRTYGPDDANRLSMGVHNLGSSLISLLANPAYTLSRWFENQSLEFWLALTVPLALLPLRGRLWLLWLSPVMLFAFGAKTSEASSQWRDPVFGHFLALGFMALVATLQTLRDSSTQVGSARMRTALIGCVVSLVPSVAMFGALYYRHGP